MPEMDGLETTRAIREGRQQAKQPCIIAMTSYALEGDMEECLRVGMDEYISKPMKMDEPQKVLETHQQSEESYVRERRIK